MAAIEQLFILFVALLLLIHFTKQTTLSAGAEVHHGCICSTDDVLNTLTTVGFRTFCYLKSVNLNFDNSQLFCFHIIAFTNEGLINNLCFLSLVYYFRLPVKFRVH